jgi:MraZ protein
MFLGEYEHTIDDKGRLTVPSKFRDELAGGLVVTRGIDRCLLIYPIAEWMRLFERVSALPLNDRRVRAFRRRFFSAASDATPDNQGRVLIPPRLREYAGLNGNVIVAGAGAYVEVWNPEQWAGERTYAEQADFDLEELKPIEI